MIYRVSIILGFTVVCTLFFTACNRDTPPLVVAVKRQIDGKDIAKILGLGAYKWEIVSPAQGPFAVQIWVKDHIATPSGPETKTQMLGRWTAHVPGDIAGDILIMLPRAPSWKSHFSVGSSTVRSIAPPDMESKLTGTMYPYTPDRIEFQDGEPAVLAVDVYGDSVTGFPTLPDMDKYIDRNLRAGDYELIRVYRVEIQSR